MTALFAVFVLTVLLAIAYTLYRFFPMPYKRWSLAGLVVWVAYMTALGYGGVIANAKLVPPGLFYMMVPMVMLAVFTARSAAGKTIAMSVPVSLLMTAESFRFVVELFLHELWRDGMLPTMMTFHGANYDIIIGASAPLVGWLLATGRLPSRLALLWNAVGIVMLANVAGRGVLTAPGVFHLLQSEVPNLMVGTFPYSYIPGLMVPLALILHILAIRALRERIRQDRDAGQRGVHAPTAQVTAER